MDEGLYPVKAITEDNIGYIWFSIPGGAIGYNPTDDNFHIIDKEDGLYNNNVRCIFQDSWGMLWFGHLESKELPGGMEAALNTSHCLMEILIKCLFDCGR